VDIAVIAAGILMLTRRRRVVLLREGLRVAGQIRLRLARAVGRLAAGTAAGRLCFVVAVVEALVTCAAPLLVLRPREVGIVLAELLLRGRDHAEIVLGVLIIILGRDRIAGRLCVARELHVLFSDV